MLLNAVGAEIVQFNDTVFMTSEDDVVCLNGIHAGDNFVVSEKALCNCKFVHVKNF